MSQPAKKLFLLDAMALIYRAHFAFSKNPRINSKGENTGAALGFTNALFEVITKEKPTHIAVAFDTSVPTFRHERYEEYKAHREAQPEDIRTAVPIIKDIVRAFNVPVLELDGYEADDIIGTIAKQAARQGFVTYMMTPDKDFGQLVEDCIFLYKPAFMGNSVDILGEKEVCEKFDIERVDQVRDVLGLQGDAVDNIPGIPGIGAKTASKLLREFGSVEAIIANADQLKGKQREKVIEFSEQGILSKELATICTTVPIAFDEEALRYGPPNDDALRPLFEDLEFKTLIRRVLETDAPAAAPQFGLFAPQEVLAPDHNDLPFNTSTDAINRVSTILTTAHDYHLVDTPEARATLIRTLGQQPTFCFDTETDRIDALEAQLVGLAFAYEPGTAYYVPVPADPKKRKRW